MTQLAFTAIGAGIGFSSGVATGLLGFLFIKGKSDTNPTVIGAGIGFFAGKALAPSICSSTMEISEIAGRLIYKK